MLERARRAALPGSLLAVAAICTFAVARALELPHLPDGDSAYIAMRIRDATTAHLPLVGMPTTLAMDVVEANHLGPLEFYLLGALDRLFLRSPWSLVVAAGIATWLALATAIAAARAAWGPLASIATALGGAWLVWSVGSHSVTEILNISPPIVATLAGLVAIAAAADGAPRWLPAGAFWMSYAAQAHLSFGPIGLTFTAVAVALAFVPSVRLPARWRGLTVGVVGLGWLPVVVDQITAEDGNLLALWRASTASESTPAGFDFASSVAGSVVGLPPPFGARPFEQALMVLWHGEGRAWRLAVPVLATAVVLGVARARGHRHGALLVGAGAVTVAVVTAARASVALGGVPSQYVRVLWPVAIVFWLVLAVTVARLTAPTPALRTAAWAVAGVALVVAIPLASDARRDLDGADIAARNQLADAAIAALLERPEIEAGATVVLSTSGYHGTHSVGPAIVAELERRGIPVRVAPGDHVPVRSYRSFRIGTQDAPVDRLDLYVGGESGAPPGAEILARFGGLDPAEHRELLGLDERLIQELERGRGTRLTELGRMVAGGDIQPSEAAAAVRERRYAELLAGRLVVDPPLPGDEVERYTDLARRVHGGWQLVAAAGP